MNKKIITLLILVGITLLILIVTSSDETPAPEELGTGDYTEQPQQEESSSQQEAVTQQQETSPEELPFTDRRADTLPAPPAQSAQ